MMLVLVADVFGGGGGLCWACGVGLPQRGQQRAGGVTEGQGSPDDRSPSQLKSSRPLTSYK